MSYTVISLHLSDQGEAIYIYKQSGLLDLRRQPSRPSSLTALSSLLNKLGIILRASGAMSRRL
jgi:hypothetical protein